jgi:hypothetical protein
MAEPAKYPNSRLALEEQRAARTILRILASLLLLLPVD